jgi:uncharacterized protein (TIGR03435 family)
VAYFRKARRFRPGAERKHFAVNEGIRRKRKFRPVKRVAYNGEKVLVEGCFLLVLAASIWRWRYGSKSSAGTPGSDRPAGVLPRARTLHPKSGQAGSATIAFRRTAPVWRNACPPHSLMFRGILIVLGATLVLLALTIGLAVRGQPPASSAWKEFSIGPASGRSTTINPDRVVSEGFSLRGLISVAYAMPSIRIVSPDWLGEAAYSVTAIVRPDAGESLQSLLQQELSTRLNLKVHVEPRPFDVLVLRVRKGAESQWVRGGRESNTWLSDHDVRAKDVTLGGFATALQSILGRPVIDETRIPGYYTFEFAWGEDRLATVKPPSKPASACSSPPNAARSTPSSSTRSSSPPRSPSCAAPRARPTPCLPVSAGLCLAPWAVAEAARALVLPHIQPRHIALRPGEPPRPRLPESRIRAPSPAACTADDANIFLQADPRRQSAMRADIRLGRYVLRTRQGASDPSAVRFPGSIATTPFLGAIAVQQSFWPSESTSITRRFHVRPASKTAEHENDMTHRPRTGARYDPQHVQWIAQLKLSI